MLSDAEAHRSTVNDIISFVQCTETRVDFRVEARVYLEALASR